MMSALRHARRGDVTAASRKPVTFAAMTWVGLRACEECFL
jgi:hypothetical protein